jgi:hypothetical protein
MISVCKSCNDFLKVLPLSLDILSFLLKNPNYFAEKENSAVLVFRN